MQRTNDARRGAERTAGGSIRTRQPEGARRGPLASIEPASSASGLQLEKGNEAGIGRKVEDHKRAARGSASDKAAMSASEYQGQVSEHDHQVVIFKWADIRMPQHPELALLYAIPNGGHRRKSVAAKLKKEGVRKGVPDICLPVPRTSAAGETWHGCYIELKREGERATMEQRWWLAQLCTQGYFARLVEGSARAIELLEWYLSQSTPRPIWLGDEK